jgi:hypothetical protein
MKWLLTVLIMISPFAFAETAWYMDIDRSGEGIILSELDDGRLVFAFYSHTAKNTGLPNPSPKPPPPRFCDKYTVWFTGLSELYEDGHASGIVYYDVAVDDFPVATQGLVSESVEVGTFIIDSVDDGFVLLMETNHVMCNLSVFGEPHFFTTKIAE